MGIIRQSDLVPELESGIGVRKLAETPGLSPLDAAWAKATAAAAVVDNAAAAFGGLDKAANDLTGGDTSAAEWPRRFDEAVGKLPVDGLPDEDLADFQAVARMQANRLKVAAVRRQHEDAVAQFESDLDGYVQRAADAPSNAIEATFRNQAFRAIERIDQAGLLGPGVADRLRAELPARIDRALALRAIERDPAHAATLLTQPGALPALDDAERARLARKAGERAVRQGHEKALADERLRAGMVETRGDKRISFKIPDGAEFAVGMGSDISQPYWKAVFRTSVRDITDLRYALGNGQIRSNGTFVFRREGDRMHVEGLVDHRLDDEKYDFNHSALELVPPDPTRGTFMVTGDDMRLLEEYEGAKTFDVRGSWQSEVSGSFRIEDGRAVDIDIRWRDRPSSRGFRPRVD